MTRTALKKIEKAGGKIDDDGESTPKTPKTPKSGGAGGRKRKAADADVAADGDDEEAKPKKKGGKKAKKEASPVESKFDYMMRFETGS